MFGGLMAIFGEGLATSVGRWVTLAKWLVVLAVVLYAVTAWFRIDALALERDQEASKAESLGATVNAMHEQKIRDDAILAERERARIADQETYRRDVRRYRLEGKDACLQKPVDPAVDELLLRTGPADSLPGPAESSAGATAGP